MAKIILNDGTEEFLSTGEARAKVSAGEATWAQGVPMYSTRQLVAEPVKKVVEPVKKRRKRKKVEPEVEATEEVKPEQVDADEVD